MDCRLKLSYTLCSFSRLCLWRSVFQSSRKMKFTSSTDALLNNLIMEAASKRESSLSQYFEKSAKSPFKTNMTHCEEAMAAKQTELVNSVIKETDLTEIVDFLEKHLSANRMACIPNDCINYLLVYFAKIGHVNGVKAVQVVVQKHNISYYVSQSEYKHYLAEALLISGKVDDSFTLFMVAYGNLKVRQKVKLMLKCLLPLLISDHGPAVMHKTINFIKKLSVEENDYILMGYLWKELFQSSWFSDQQLGKQLLQQNPNLLQVIQWMIPSVGKHFLNCNRTDDFYRLLELTLEYKLKKYEELLVRLLFDFYYMQRNIKRCSEVVRYLSNGKSPLTEEQQRRYVQLLLESKDSRTAQLNIKVSRPVKFKF